MKWAFICIFFCVHFSLLGQDTIYSKLFTGESTILLKENGTFKHFFEHDKGVDLGFGTFIKQNSHISLSYRRKPSVQSYLSCLEGGNSDSLKMKVFNLVDSGKLDFYYLQQGDSLSIFLQDSIGFKPIHDTIKIRDRLKNELILVPERDSCRHYALYFFPYIGVLDRGNIILYFTEDGMLSQPNYMVNGREEKLPKPLKYYWYPEAK